jgi:hypothetical protein
MRFALALVIVPVIPKVARAQCGPPASSLYKSPDLAFSGTIISVDSRAGVDFVSFEVDRVWSGQVHRKETLAVGYGIESNTNAEFVRIGTRYLVVSYWRIDALSDRDRAVDPSEPVGTLLAFFGCSDVLRPVSESTGLLRQLGKGRRPLK